MGWSYGSWCSGMVVDAREVRLGSGEVDGLHFLVGYCGFDCITGKIVLEGLCVQGVTSQFWAINEDYKWLASGLKSD